MVSARYETDTLHTLAILLGSVSSLDLGFRHCLWFPVNLSPVET
jgi:hypothetical protein